MKFVEHWKLVESCIKDFEFLKIDPNSLESALLRAVKFELHVNCQFLLENGDVAFCFLPRGFPEGESNVWMVSGSRKPLILTKTQCGYRY
jgi:hypothetical protein